MATLKGFSFPFRKGAISFPETATDNDVIRQSLIVLLGTVRGERQMHPDFGVDIISKLFESDTPALAEAIRYDVMFAIAKHESRVKVKRIDVSRDINQGLLMLDIFYNAITTAQLQQLQITLNVPLGG